MELRERIARAVVPHMHYADEWEEADSPDRQRALEIADDVIETLGLTREVELVEPRATSWTRFVPYMAERYVTLWERSG